ncbi:glycosyl transferase family 4 [Parahaliea aestuarii]|uniref:Glycosyl transferase family 4 n=1 Tax=Parahaliea aestuarii TaxID=1852021 RepID=A0A5C9A4V3_9GAMM|nr:glycosyl transferase family 4 [Parahaliea aestuarii]TXS95099.1 glycosyl transferase family 4 [Parahaliea aestuarii]
MLALLAVIASAGLCGLYLGIARRKQWLDHPNHRSSHDLPTPHGGGVGIVLGLAAVTALAAAWGVQWPAPVPWMVMLALFLMLLGVLDDVRGLSVPLRFALYGLCCLALVLMLVMPREIGCWWLVLPAVLALLWGLNLYNFMDGIDGFAALQCFFSAGAAALLAWIYGNSAQYALFCLLLAAVHLGFLFWNLPPARLFMGDAGSIPTGLLLGGLLLWGGVSGALAPAVWLILLAVFLTDSSWTLMRRLLRGSNVLQAHREHLYQRLSRHWGGHLAVDMALVAVLTLWLFPLAWLAQTNQHHSLFLVTLAYTPLLICMAKTADLT